VPEPESDLKCSSAKKLTHRRKQLMPNIDIKVSADLQKLFKLPDCDDIKLPKPEPLKLNLPLGGAMQAMADISKGIPNDCSMTFSLMLQIAPFLASIECLLRILKLVKPLIDIVNGLTSIPPSPPAKAIQEFAAAVPPVIECIPIPPFTNILLFIRDLLCLILKVLKCFLDQLKSIIGILSGIQLQFQAASTTGNTELITALQCAQENTQIQARHLMKSIEPVSVILDLAGSLMALAKIDPIKIPSLGDQADLQSLNTVVQTVQAVAGTIQIVVDGLGGCGS
jgi:hypothetical protein